MEKRQLKRYRLVFTAIFVFVLIMSCAKKTNAAKSAAGDDEIGGDLTFIIWDPSQKPSMDAGIDLFTKEYPNASVSLQNLPWGDYWQKLRTSVSAGNMPDISWAHVMQFNLFASSGALMDLTDRIATDPEISMDNYQESIVKLYQYEGVQYAIPKDFDTIALWYNKTLFDQAGIPYPNDQWTWDDMAAAAEKLTNKEEGIYGFVDGGAQQGYWNFIYQNGGYVIRPNGRSGFDMPETIEAVKFYANFVKNGSAPAPGEGGYDLLLSGKLAMAQMGSPSVQFVYNSDYARNNMDLTILPRGKKRATISNGLGYSIAENTKNPETAWAFVKIMGEGETQQMQAAYGSVIPAYKEGTYQPWADSFDADFSSHLEVYLEQLPYEVGFVTAPGQAEWFPLMQETMGKILGGVVPVEDGLKKLAEKMNRIIDENS